MLPALAEVAPADDVRWAYAQGDMRPRAFTAALLGLTLLIASGPASAQESPVPQGVAFVPVLRFWSPERDIALEEVRSAIEGRSDRYSSVVIGAEDPAALWDALGVTPAASVRSASVDEVRAAVEGSRKTVGLLPAGQVGPDVRALAVDGVGLFGSDRVRQLGTWPLLAAGSELFDPEQTWTIMAGGDVMLDREPHRKSVIEGRGPDFPWSGGFAEITARTCCTVDGGPAIAVRRVGPRGAVRELLSSADIAIVNHEAPAPDEPLYHASGLVFNVDPAMLPGVADAGVDVVSLANNHIRNAGSEGVRDTIRNLRAAGIRTFGAGRDPARARKPACFEQAELQVCLLGYNAINTVSHAVSDTRAGAAELVADDVRSDIRALRRGGADVIVVWPHWGPEYVTRVVPQQRRQARAMVKAGADVVLGAHSHVTGPLEFIDGVPVAYSMGDLIFDLPRFEATEEGVLVELTFHGADLAQLELHPTVMVDRAQVNLLRRDGDGGVVIARMRKASKQLH
jgi:poly-gamma-glutamate synthesis protein (capsule biosynthesis protein)